MYYYKNCTICGQDKLYVFKNLTTKKLYLHCGECEYGFNDPENLDPSNAFLTLLEPFDAEEATLQDIKLEGWDRFDLKES